MLMHVKREVMARMRCGREGGFIFLKCARKTEEMGDFDELRGRQWWLWCEEKEREEGGGGVANGRARAIRERKEGRRRRWTGGARGRSGPLEWADPGKRKERKGK